MKKYISKFIKLTMSILMIMILAVGCVGNKDSSKETNGKVDAGDGKSKGDNIKVGLILEGPISDMSWNATSYEGLKKIEALGAETSYQENVGLSAVADSIRTYATEGFDMIILSSNTFTDVAKQTAKDFPDVQFIQINGEETVDNFTSVKIADDEQGFLMGAISAIISTEKQVGFVGGLEITPIVNGRKGFEEGVKHVDPSIKINATLTGSFDNVNQAKETAKAIIESGSDVIAPMCDQASLGVIEAAEESDKAKIICTSDDQKESSKKTGIISVNKDTSVAYEAVYKRYLDKDLPNEVIKMGVADGVVFLSDWFDAAGELTDDMKDKIMDLYESMKNGDVVVNIE